MAGGGIIKERRRYGESIVFFFISWNVNINTKMDSIKNIHQEIIFTFVLFIRFSSVILLLLNETRISKDQLAEWWTIGNDPIILSIFFKYPLMASDLQWIFGENQNEHLTTMSTYYSLLIIIFYKYILHIIIHTFSFYQKNSSTYNARVMAIAPHATSLPCNRQL